MIVQRERNTRPGKKKLRRCGIYETQTEVLHLNIAVPLPGRVASEDSELQSRVRVLSLWCNTGGQTDNLLLNTGIEQVVHSDMG